MSPKIIPVEERGEEAREAWRLFCSGVSKSEIARQLSRNRRTVDKLLREAAEWYEDDDMQFKRRYLVSAHREVLRLALEGANELPAKSPSRAQHLYAANEAIKGISRLEGAIVHRTESKNTSYHATLADLVREAKRLQDERAATVHVLPALPDQEESEE